MEIINKLIKHFFRLIFIKKTLQHLKHYNFYQIKNNQYQQNKQKWMIVFLQHYKQIKNDIYNSILYI